ncbi:hypothetical protein [Fictibacillus macauensis]|uniref:hypothetical protein n=1 Tax=Fictibacillus macauensis TaxID=245160 RepID=UPI00138952E7|nr:hypothetical protein [Fictibacillus macauensis]
MNGKTIKTVLQPSQCYFNETATIRNRTLSSKYGSMIADHYNYRFVRSQRLT